MALILKKAWDGYQYAFQELVDPRTAPWPIVAKPYQIVLVVGLYLMFCLKWGPEWMKNRKPYNIDRILIVYNIFQIISSAYLFYKALMLGWLWDFKWFCEPVDFSYTPRPLEIAWAVYLYFLVKVVDLLDTVFFILRKKFYQVSFLHIYHHAGMVLLIWGAVTYLPGGHGTLVGCINSFVHVVMYSYYLLTVLKPSMKNALWLKKSITQIQIIQFLWLVIHMGSPPFMADCGYPVFTSFVFVPQNLFMLVLFIDFYIKTYIKSPKNKLNGTTKKDPHQNSFLEDGKYHKNK